MEKYTNIKTYQSSVFRELFIKTGEQSDRLLGEGFGWFFIAKVEQMLSFMKHAVPPVRTTTHSFIFITEGEANLLVGDQVYKIKKNEGLFVPQGQVFSFDKKDQNKGYFCNFSNDIITNKLGEKNLYREFDFLTIWGNPKISLDVETAGFILNLMKRLYLKYTQNGLKQLLVIQSYFIALLVEVNSIYETTELPKNSRLDLTRRFKIKLYQYIREKQSVQDYAALLNISSNYLNKVLKETTGKSTNTWIQEVLISEAKLLLWQTNLSIKEVAFDLGDLDASYFSRMFKRRTGLSPRAYKSKIKKS